MHNSVLEMQKILELKKVSLFYPKCEACEV